MKLGNTEVFSNTAEVVVGNKIYIVERHFSGKRGVAEAINTVVQNAAKRELLTESAI